MTETVISTRCPSVPLRWVRKSQGLTMRELAYFARCSTSTIQQIENGTLSGSPQIKARIARALRRPVWDLFPPEPPEEGFHQNDARPVDEPGAVTNPRGMGAADELQV